MNEKINCLIYEIKEISKKHSELETTIVFGSVARDQAGKESDLDICFILKNENLKNIISNQMLGLEKKYDKNINVIFTDPLYKDIDRSRHFNPTT